MTTPWLNKKKEETNKKYQDNKSNSEDHIHDKGTGMQLHIMKNQLLGRFIVHQI